jgi:hypothetical protein
MRDILRGWCLASVWGEAVWSWVSEKRFDWKVMEALIGAD